MQLQIRTSDRPPHVEVTGEIDRSNCWRLRRTLDRLIEEGHSRLALDLGGVAFIDSSGVAVLIGCAKTLNEKGGAVKVLGCNATVYRILFGCGLTALFGMGEQQPAYAAAAGPKDRWLVCSFSVPASTLSPSIIRDRIGQVIADLPLSETEVADVKLAVGEAATNAVKHGSRGGLGRISVRCVADHQALTIEVSDDGPGFDRSAVPPPDWQDYPTGGMGIAIMELVMDRVSFLQCSGTTVRMLKRLRQSQAGC